MGDLVILFPLAAILFVLLFFVRYVSVRLWPTTPLPEPYCESPCGPDWPKRRYPLERRDIIPMVAIVIVYAAVAFFRLGDTTAPQTFCHFAESGRYALVELEEPTEISRVRYYTGLYTANYYVQYSQDGEEYTDICMLEQGHAALFKWQEADLSAAVNYGEVRYIRIIADGKLEMGELAIYDESGRLIPESGLIYDQGCAPLFDEQELIPDEASYMNSTYFDEIYHARTAYENIKNVYPYEVSHPPLGKLILSIGIRLFGMTPFGWRFMGTLFGVLMLPFLYWLIKQLFGSSLISACGTTIFAFDFMHYAQTRIATIDTYAVFWIILMYLFMYRFITSDPDRLLARDRRGLLDLFLCGLFFGLGCASKWTCVYAGIGLALIWLLYWVFRGRGLIKSGRGREFPKELALNIACCLAFFVVIPAAIYYVSYYPYGKASGMSGIGMFFTRDYLNIVVDNQKFMFSYHSNLVSTHPYSSEWYKWIFDIRPILYYLNYFDDGTKSTIGAFVNPVLCWGGLVAIVIMLIEAVFRRDKKALFIFIGYLSQLGPWLLITRLTFEYHYFPSVVFLTLAICHIFSTFKRRSRHWVAYVCSFTGVCLVLFCMFYPVLSGASVSTSYATSALKWLSTWPF